MKKGKFILKVLLLLIVLASLFLFINRDKFAYVGSVDYIEVDCDRKQELLSEVYISDRKIRMSNEFIKYAKEDHRNQELIISIIEKCGMPTLSDVSQDEMNAIWLGLQHTEKKYRLRYFPLIEKAVDNGDLSQEQWALMKDRILMDKGEPQIYGTQFNGSKLYDLADPETVNQRRAEIGLEPIEEYLKKNGVDFQPH